MAVWVGQRSDNRSSCARARQESRSVSLAAPNYSKSHMIRSASLSASKRPERLPVALTPGILLGAVPIAEAPPPGAILAASLCSTVLSFQAA